MVWHQSEMAWANMMQNKINTFFYDIATKTIGVNHKLFLQKIW
jgi:hypothetical protein